MLDSIKKLFGGKSVNYSELVKGGAIIVDVRNKGEYAAGHIKGSINIPLPELQNNLAKLKKDKTVITCCVSGIRSASAKSVLKSSGFVEVHNGGGWMSLRNKL